jgi:hypothetical protein
MEMKWAVAFGSGLIGWGVVIGALGFIPRVPLWWVETGALFAAIVGVLWCEETVFGDINQWLAKGPPERRQKWERPLCYGLVFWWLPVLMIFMTNWD